MVVHLVHLESKDALQIQPTALQCIWVHLESFFPLQMYKMHYHSAYGPNLWSVCAMVAHWVYFKSIEALQMHPKVLECSWVHLESVYVCSLNVPNALP